MAKKKADAKATEPKQCELCGDRCENRIGCSVCGKMICPACEAARPEDEQDGDVVCEQCF